MVKEKNCMFCGSTASYDVDYQNDMAFHVCPVCGRYEINAEDKDIKLDVNKTASYLLYNCFSKKAYSTEYRYHTVQSKELCDTYKKRFKKGDISQGYPVHMDADIINNWYPKTFAERVDFILLYLNERASHIGQQITLSYAQMMGMLFVDRKELDSEWFSDTRGQMIPRNEEECKNEAKYMLDSLVDSGLIKYNFGSDEEKAVFITLTPLGYSRVDTLQKNSSYGRSVLVAMKFGEETLPLREAIRKGVTDAGYIAVFIDEVQHNDFITPELLKHIRDSKFVIADLTHKNNGAYFEEGYAMGLGKPVIQLCKKRTKLHFDIAQKNTIFWSTEDDIPEMLSNRIRATID